VYNFKFQLPQRKRCIWHPNAVALTMRMEMWWNQGSLPQGESDERPQERHFILEIKGLFSQVVSFIITSTPPATGTPCKCTAQGTASLSSFCLRFPGTREEGKLVLFATYLNENFHLSQSLKMDQLPLWSKHHATCCLK
jgi:hypothetical protein